jgi:hypothetical protein
MRPRRNWSSYFFESFTRGQWAKFEAGSYRLSADALSALKGVNEPLMVSEVDEVIGPLCRLLELKIEPARTSPFVIAVAGSVAVGKSTFSRILRTLLAQSGRTVELVATDGFLWPIEVLVERNLLARKGWPESYDLKSMLEFLSQLKAGSGSLQVPMYSHEAYNIIPGEFQTIGQGSTCCREATMRESSLRIFLISASTSMPKPSMSSDGTSSASPFCSGLLFSAPPRIFIISRISIPRRRAKPDATYGNESTCRICCETFSLRGNAPR